MKTYIMVGDICHPGRITVRAETLEEAVEKADDGDFVVYDEDPKNLAFTWNHDHVETENYEPQAHSATCASRHMGECTCGEFEKQQV